MVKINLRKAAALQTAITDAINNIDITTDVNITEFEDVASVLQKANDTLFSNDSRRQQLLLAYYNIRGLVSTANAGSGVNTLLAKAAFTDKRIAQIEMITNVRPMLDINVISGKLEKIRNRSDDRHEFYGGRDDTVYTGIVTQEQMAQAKAEIQNLKKQKQAINDELLELNVKTEIPLSEEVVECLQQEGIL